MINKKDVNHAVEHALNTSSCFETVLFYMKYCKGKNLHYIGNMFNISHESVRKYTFRVLERIKNEL